MVCAFQADKSLESLDDRWGNRMDFSVAAPAIDAGIGKTFGGCGCGGIAFRVTADGLLGKLRKFDSGDLGGCVGEVIFDEGWTDSDRFEKLASVVAAEHADPHLRHNFQKALVYGLPVGRNDLGGIEIGESAFGLPAGGQFPNKVGRYGCGSETQKAGEVVNIPTVGGVCNEGGAHAKASSDQAVMYGGNGEEHRKGAKVGLGSTI